MTTTLHVQGEDKQSCARTDLAADYKEKENRQQFSNTSPLPAFAAKQLVAASNTHAGSSADATTYTAAAKYKDAATSIDAIADTNTATSTAAVSSSASTPLLPVTVSPGQVGLVSHAASCSTAQPATATAQQLDVLPTPAAATAAGAATAAVAASAAVAAYAALIGVAGADVSEEQLEQVFQDFEDQTGIPFHEWVSQVSCETSSVFRYRSLQRCTSPQCLISAGLHASSYAFPLLSPLHDF